MTESRRDIGFWTAVSLVIGGMVGSGVFTLPASLASFGGLSVAAWAIAALGSVLLAIVFAHLARRNAVAGGVYGYTRESFGDLAGFLVAWGYWISVWSANAALSLSFAGYAGSLLPWLATSKPAAARLAIGTLWFLTGVNSLGVGAAGRVQVATTSLKLLPLVIVGVGGLLYIDPSHFALPVLQPEQSYGGLLLAAVTITMFAFVGLESATIPSAATRDPQRTIPRATMIGTVLTAVIYVVSTAGALSLIAPAMLAQSSAPFADAARALGGSGLAAVVAIGAAVSSFGSLNGWVLIVGQLPLAVARDGLFPAPFARLSPRGVPLTGMLISAALSTGLIALTYSGAENLVALFTKITLISTLSTLVPYAFCSLAVFLPGGRRATHLSRGLAAGAAVAFLYAMFAIAGAGPEVVWMGFLLILGGLPVYVWAKRDVRA
ncbi:MAG TPA: amino acid permease [Vicinamibacterales bacterium]|nr:amino acid permease [Vicinamibacterales bacterium]